MCPRFESWWADTNENIVKKQNRQKKEIVLILHNIRSAYNIGSIFRTADACSIDKIFLTGYSPSPVDKFGNKRKDISKTALGAEKSVEWQHCKNLSKIIDKLKAEKFEICAIEQDKESVSYKKYKLKNKTAFVFGNEVRGLSKEALQKCDRVLEIPMKGKKESLNVSVSAGIVLFEKI